MKIGLLSHAFPPHPRDTMTLYHEETARALVDAGHEVHVVTNHAWYGASSPYLTAPYWREGNLHIHRTPLLDEEGKAPSFLRFFDVDPTRYEGGFGRWAMEPFHLASLHLADFVSIIHTEIGLDVLEAPDRFAESYYIIRRRIAGRKDLFPPVSVTCHGTSRENWAAEGKTAHLGEVEKRRLMLREEFCIRNADGLLALVPDGMKKLEGFFGEPLPGLRTSLESPDDLRGKVAHLEKAAASSGSPPGLGPFSLPPRLLPGRPPEPLPDSGIILIDTLGQAPEMIRPTIKSVQESLPGSTDWEVHLLADESLSIPPAWSRVQEGGPLPWEKRPAGTTLVYILAGTRLDSLALRALVSTALEASPPSGAFLWLRPINVNIFPYRSDMGFHDILLAGGVLPCVFAASCGSITPVKTLKGLETPASRIATLMGTAAFKGVRFLHTGEVQGDFYGEIPLLHPEDQAFAVGYLDLLGFLPWDLVAVGSMEPPRPPSEPSPRESSTGIPIEELERVYREHQNLKNMAIVRFLRKTGVLELARKCFPRLTKAIGPGGQKG